MPPDAGAVPDHRRANARGGLDATAARHAALLDFIALADRLKHVLRASRTGERRENAGEHAWHVALIAVLLADEVQPRPDMARVLGMIAIHDLIEIESGDTFAFDEAGLLTQSAREEAAAARIFGLLPDHGLRALWDEFEAQETPEARFAMGCDRLQGFAQQVECGAPAWLEIGLTRARSLVRMQPAIDLGPPFAPMIEALYARAMAEGLLRP
ncbi:HD domain-containing protein [Sediminicoccus sp. KRV36]|uniref:HD domain-containing protein n=1 Tax=Sediminicoccus sp. KRV36 TaxID=3133721 RepID=UPI00200D87C9|nr:HD domain-containing protein [Sediminicoccus rosea]UPY35145.1 HD domain-containing protein [Sediminicoccus rosea]